MSDYNSLTQCVNLTRYENNNEEGIINYIKEEMDTNPSVQTILIIHPHIREEYENWKESNFDIDHKFLRLWLWAAVRFCQMAGFNKHTIMQGLLKEGTDFYFSNHDIGLDGNAQNLLEIMMIGRNGDMISDLIDAGLDVNHKYKNGDTNLHCAVRCCDVHVVKVLLENGANVNVVNKDRKTLLDYAIELLARHPRLLTDWDKQQLSEIVELLIKYTLLHDISSKKPDAINGASRFWDRCIAELQTKIGEKSFKDGSKKDILLYEFLTANKDQLLSNAFDKDVRDNVYQDLRAGKFPIHSDMIKNKLAEVIQLNLCKDRVTHYLKTDDTFSPEERNGMEIFTSEIAWYIKDVKIENVAKRVAAKIINSSL